MYLCLEFDDFHPSSPENCIEEIDQLVDLFPDIKLSMFTIPMLRGVPLWIDADWCRRVRAHVRNGNIEINRHGLTHDFLEFRNLSTEEAEKRLMVGDHIMNISKIPYKRVFRAPHWGVNANVMAALNSQGYTHFYNHVDYCGVEASFAGKTKYYNWDIGVDLVMGGVREGEIIGHGHTHDVCGNGIGQCLSRLTEFLNNNLVQFMFASELE